jgi:hypothetical protein
MALRFSPYSAALSERQMGHEVGADSGKVSAAFEAMDEYVSR